MDQLNKNLSKNNGVNEVGIKSDKFFNLHKLLDKCYKRPESGLVYCTLIFTMYKDRPGIFELHKSTDSPFCTQNLKKGNVNNKERKNFFLNIERTQLPRRN